MEKKEESCLQCSTNSLQRLVGCPPFWHRRQVVMLRSIMEGRYHFHSPEWDDISASAKNLVSTSYMQCTTFLANKQNNIYIKLEEFFGMSQSVDMLTMLLRDILAKTDFSDNI